MATFHPFPRLPFELRARIWEMTVEHRKVEIRYGRTYATWGPNYGPVRHVKTPTPIPAVMHACREARNLGFWVNFDADLISIEERELEILGNDRRLIRRVQFCGENTANFFLFGESELDGFDCLEEVLVVCRDDLEDLVARIEVLEGIQWPFPKGIITFIDKTNGERLVDGCTLNEEMDIFQS
ncbi:hypothetical protein NM208_g1142 [Fusarium decemcellulare]|uniref:Uncharacterized protein n=1 Tax=Fusarium decemcellulare TaxID=57161 RepID=A0ACC1SWW1_9HYPO|nr:hypothetical protein NM208_g1142 [Fusarium decemcellulare]